MTIEEFLKAKREAEDRIRSEVETLMKVSGLRLSKAAITWSDWECSDGTSGQRDVQVCIELRVT